LTLHELTVHEAAERLRSGDVTSTELTRAVLERIDWLGCCGKAADGSAD